MKTWRFGFAVLIVLAAGCASIEGTYDKSATTVRAPSAIKIDSVAILPIREYAAAEGLSSQIEAALPQSVVKNLPSARAVDSQAFSASLERAGLLQDFGQWASTYDTTSVIDKKPLAAFAKAVNARYFLVVRSLYLNHEKVGVPEAIAVVGHGGTVSDANNIWRTDLKASVVLIDANYGVVVWQGTGRAENISSKKKDIDLGIIIFNKKSPEVADFLGQLVQSLADGIAAQIARQPG